MATWVFRPSTVFWRFTAKTGNYDRPPRILLWGRTSCAAYFSRLVHDYVTRFKGKTFKFPRLPSANHFHPIWKIFSLPLLLLPLHLLLLHLLEPPKNEILRYCGNRIRLTKNCFKNKKYFLNIGENRFEIVNFAF